MALPPRNISRSRLILGHGSFAAQAEELAQIVRAHLGDPRFASADDRLGQRHLAFDQVVERFLERARAEVFVHLDVTRLTDAEGAIRGLILNGRVPPAIEVEYVVGAGEVEPRPARL